MPKVNLSRWGSFDAKIQLNNNARLGYYWVAAETLATPSDTSSWREFLWSNFQVEAFRSAEFKVSAHVPAKILCARRQPARRFSCFLSFWCTYGRSTDILSLFVDPRVLFSRELCGLSVRSAGLGTWRAKRVDQHRDLARKWPSRLPGPISVGDPAQRFEMRLSAAAVRVC